MLVFAIDDQYGYEMVEKRHGSILKVKESSKIPMILIGNKCDLEDTRVIAQDSAKERAKSWNIDYLETSAKVFLL